MMILNLIVLGAIVLGSAAPTPRCAFVEVDQKPLILDQRAMENAAAIWRVCPSAGCTQSRVELPDGTVLIWT
jgi:hypothetical protein